MKLRKGDTVMIMRGKDRGKRGKVLRVFPLQERVVVEGVNMRKKHIRKKREGEKGQTVQIPSSLHGSNVHLVCPKCGTPTKIRMSKEGEAKVRVCKKCEGIIS